MRLTGNDDEHVRVLLGALLLGGLSAPEESAVRAHLGICAQCRAEHDYLACVPRWLDLLRDETADGAPAADGAARDMTRKSRPAEPRSSADPGAGPAGPVA
jgi:anti-sigma factor RsiW